MNLLTAIAIPTLVALVTIGAAKEKSSTHGSKMPPIASHVLNFIDWRPIRAMPSCQP
jgi:hypothetical protein